MSTTTPDEDEREEMDWRERIVAEQARDVPKTRGRTYYYADGLFDQRQMWVTHTPGSSIPMRVNTVWSPAIRPDKEYESSLEMNIGSEINAYRLYLALRAYFEDERTTPWFLADVDLNDE